MHRIGAKLVPRFLIDELPFAQEMRLAENLDKSMKQNEKLGLWIQRQKLSDSRTLDLNSERELCPILQEAIWKWWERFVALM